MQHNYEKKLENSPSFKSDINASQEIIQTLTQKNKERLIFFNNLVESAIKDGKINNDIARLITLTSNASVRSVVA